MNAVILERKEEVLIPLTLNCPKLMLNIMDRPLIYHISDYLNENGITAYTLLGIKREDAYPEEIYEKFTVMEEETDIYTDIKNMDEDILLIAKPMITDMPLKKAFEYHEKKGGITSIYNKGKETGIYIISKGALNESSIVNKYALSGYYTGLSTSEEYLACHRDILKGKISVKTECSVKNKGVMVGENTMLKIGALIKPPVYIGKGTVIESGARIEAYSVIGSDCVISKGALIGGAVVNKGCFIGEDAILKKSLVAPLAKIKRKANLNEFCAVGEASVIGEAAMISKGINIWNEKFVPAGEKITKNFINGRKIPVFRFENNRVTGNAGPDFTPEDAALLGACFSRIYPSLKIAVASCSSPVASMIRYAVISGIQSSGGEVLDAGVNSEAVLRFGIDYLKCAGGIYIYEDKEVILRFFGKNYTDIRSKDFKRLRNMYPELKFARAEAKNIKAVNDAKNISSIYYEKICSRFSYNKDERYAYLKGEKSDLKYIKKLCDQTGLRLITHRKKGYISGIIKNEALFLYDEDENLLTDDEVNKILWLVAQKDENEYKVLSSDRVYSFFKICTHLYDKKITLKEFLVF